MSARAELLRAWLAVVAGGVAGTGEDESSAVSSAAIMTTPGGRGAQSLREGESVRGTDTRTHGAATGALALLRLGGGVSYSVRATPSTPAATANDTAAQLSPVAPLSAPRSGFHRGDPGDSWGASHHQSNGSFAFAAVGDFGADGAAASSSPADSSEGASGSDDVAIVSWDAQHSTTGVHISKWTWDVEEGEGEGVPVPLSQHTSNRAAAAAAAAAAADDDEAVGRTATPIARRDMAAAAANGISSAARKVHQPGGSTSTTHLTRSTRCFIPREARALAAERDAAALSMDVFVVGKQ